MSDPLLVARPAIDGELASQVLFNLYGVSGRLTELHGERDLNLKVDAATGERYLLKIVSPGEPHELVEMRTMAIEHVRRVDPTIPVPCLVRTTTGGDSGVVVAPDGRSSEVQLFSFLDGHNAEREELGEQALYDWGREVARLGRALRGFFHPAARFEIQWDVRHTGTLTDRLHLLEPAVRDLAARVIERFVSNVEPSFEALRAQFIHDDMHRGNLLVDAGGRIVGITDFGDATHTALVCDLAVAICDVLNGRADSLDMAEAMIAGYCSLTALEPEEAQVLFDLVAARAATDVVVTTWRRLHHPHATETPTGSIELLKIFTRLGFDQAAARFERVALAGASARRPSGHARPSSTRALLAARRRVMGPLSLSYDEPLHLVRGKGVHLFDADGHAYIDAYNNVPVVGHCHPRVAAAIATQARLLVTNSRYLQGPSVELAERLLATAPAALERVLLVNSGSEANDVAWRICHFATGRDGVLVTRYAYHGVTTATTDLSPEDWVEGYAPERVGLLRAPGTGAPDAKDVLDRLSAGGHEPGAFYFDPAFISDGILGPAREWVGETVHAVRRAGALVVADEVQAGYGRTGESLWASLAVGVDADVMTIGKPMGNGFPVAALLARADLVDPFVEATNYFSTFGGNTLACAAALAVLDVVADEGLVAHAAAVGARLRAHLDSIARRHDRVAAVRGWGLLFGLDVVDHAGAPSAPGAAQVVNDLRQRGVLVGTTGPHDNVVKIRPPLVIDDPQVDAVAERLDEALALVP